MYFMHPYFDQQHCLYSAVAPLSNMGTIGWKYVPGVVAE